MSSTTDSTAIHRGVDPQRRAPSSRGGAQRSHSEAQLLFSEYKEKAAEDPHVAFRHHLAEKGGAKET